MADIIYREKIITISKARFGWSKYGGARHGLVKQKGKWYCQACGKEQPDTLPAFMMCVDNGEFREFIRLCACCENLVKKYNIKNFKTLKNLVKRKNKWDDFDKIFKINCT